MKRFDLLFTLLLLAVGVLLIVNAGQPLTPEAEIVQAWYNALCAEPQDFGTLARLTWRGSLSEEQFRQVIIRYRKTISCVSIINHDLIFFQWIPPEHSTTIRQIKFVAVNVYTPDEPREPNHVLSVRAGVHVIFFKSDEIRVMASFLGIPLTDSAAPGQSIVLFNNDGLAMGTAQITAPVKMVQSESSILIGVPVTLNPSRAWGSYTIRLYAKSVQAESVNLVDDLPQAYRQGFLPAYGEGIEAEITTEGVVWFRDTDSSDSIRLSFEVNQTLWDMRPLPAFADVVITP